MVSPDVFGWHRGEVVNCCWNQSQTAHRKEVTQEKYPFLPRDKSQGANVDFYQRSHYSQAVLGNSFLPRAGCKPRPARTSQDTRVLSTALTPLCSPSCHPGGASMRHGTNHSHSAPADAEAGDEARNEGDGACLAPAPSPPLLAKPRFVALAARSMQGPWLRTRGET